MVNVIFNSEKMEFCRKNVCRVTDDSDLSGVGIFNCDPEEAERIMNGDLGVIAGIFTYETHLCSSFPGDNLPCFRI